MPRLILKDALYTPLPDEHGGKSAADSAVEIDAVLRRHVAAIGAGRGHAYASARRHYLCSTMMDLVFSGHAVDTGRALGDGAAVPQSFTHAYECACWGYCLQYHLQHHRGQNAFVISIMDVNSMEMRFWSANEQWGKSGFGVTTLYFEVDAGADAELDGAVDGGALLPTHTGVAAGGNNIIAFASVAKQVARKFQAARLALPFFPANMAVPVRRSLKDQGLLGDWHHAYGHAFGSDPWIAFIRDHGQAPMAGQQIVFGSLALRGYYCFAHVHVAADVNVQHF